MEKILAKFDKFSNFSLHKRLQQLKYKFIYIIIEFVTEQRNFVAESISIM